jgi:hypothetical protein
MHRLPRSHPMQNIGIKPRLWILNCQTNRETLEDDREIYYRPSILGRNLLTSVDDLELREIR